MGVEIRRLDEDDADTWDGHVERSPHGNPFHRYDALAVQAAHADASLHALAGYKGQEPVGLFPLFEIAKGPVRTVFSPPPDLRVPYLGPALLNMGKLKQRKRERRQRRFVDGCFEWVESNVGPKFVNVRVDGRYDDLRPFKWNDCSVTPSHTYVVNLTDDPDEVIMRFSSDARSNVRKQDDDAYSVAAEGADAVERIVEQVAARFEAQGESFHLTPEFARDLYEGLPDGRLRPYVLRVDGEFVGGLLVVDDGDTLARWQGGVRTGLDVDLPVNDLLDWHVMRDGMAEGRTGYDLVGAENPRINEYKAKFNPELRQFYNIERSGFAAGAVASLYQRFRSGGK